MSIINIDLTKKSIGNQSAIFFKKEEFILNQNNQNPFVLSNNAKQDSETVHLNGLLLKAKNPNSDYSLSNKTLNLNIETNIGDLLTIAYATADTNGSE